MSNEHSVIEEAGNRYGSLVVVERSFLIKADCRARWLCQCDCGSTKVVIGSSLRTGKTKSCGCQRYEHLKTQKHPTVHGMYRHYAYRMWVSMIDRCYNESSSNYEYYGARGIKVYEVWKENPIPFIEWIEENLGVRPEGYSLDRINNEGGYEPGNLRWATAKQQNNNRRKRDVARKTHCPQNHPYNEINTYVHSDGRRDCCICRRESGRRYREKKSLVEAMKRKVK